MVTLPIIILNPSKAKPSAKDYDAISKLFFWYLSNWLTIFLSLFYFEINNLLQLNICNIKVGTETKAKIQSKQMKSNYSS